MRFNNWNLEMDTFPVRQYDNLTRRLEVSGDIPDGWSWGALLSIGDNLNIISLQYGEPGLYVDLTADMIPYAGKYNLQLRATQGDKVRHTNIVQMQVNDSMSGDAVWPELPSEFSQAEQRITELNEHPPKPGDNGFWLTWNVETDQYEESDIPLPDVSVGPQGPAGPEGPPGPTGTTPQISVTVTTLPAGQDVTVQVSGPAEAPTIAFGIPQGEPGERGPQGLQGFQGWGLSAAELDSDGALVLTIRNPADGQTQTLPPVPIDNSDALQAVAAAITAQGTTQVQRVEEAGDDAVGAVSTAKDAAMEAVGQAKTTATGAVQSAQQTAVASVGTAKTDAVQAVQTAREGAETAISQASAQGVSAVNTAKGEAMESVGALVQQAEDAAIRQPVISDDDTWMIWDAASGQYVDTGLYAGGQAPYIGEDGYWYVGNVKTDTLAQGPAGPAGAGVPPTDTAQPGDVPTWDGDQVVWAEQQGGIGRWTLLLDATTLESVYSILVSQDARGKEFNVSELIFDINLPVLSASPGYVRFINGLSYDVNNGLLAMLSSVGSTSTIWYGYGWIKLLSGVPALVSGGAKTNIYNASTVIRSYGAEFSQDISNIDSINSFGIYFQKSVDAGSRIRVWGR